MPHTTQNGGRIRHLDLFSGIGGFALAVDTVWPGSEHIFCDNDLFCQKVLKKHWPNSYIYGDIRTLTYADEFRRVHGELEKLAAKRQHETQRQPIASVEPPFILTGGFPCQPFSNAGRRKGTADDRHLWPEMLRVIREFSPQWVIGENVGGFVTWNDGMVLRQVFADLEGEGYEVQAFIIPACAVNAPHRRDRVWIVAHSSSNGHNSFFQGINNGNTETKSPRKNQVRFPGKRNNYASNSESVHEERWHSGQEQEQFRRSGWSENWVEVATKFCRVDDGIPRRMDRNKRLKALGNAIVPQVAIEIMKAIKEVSNP